MSCFFVPPSTDYWDYMDFRVLALLFCLMVVVAAMEKIGLFTVLADRIVGRTKTMVGLGGALVFLCFFFAMVVTNDVALITFVPFTVQVLEMVKGQDKLIPIVVLQTVAANLGSMLTPIGNPQNLYLFSAFHMEMDHFLNVMTPVTGLSAGLLALCCFLFLRSGKGELITVSGNGWDSGRERPEIASQDKGKLLLYIALFCLCFMTVVHILPWQTLVIIILLFTLMVDRSLIRRVDYGLLLTFACFFIFVGNGAAIPAVSAGLSHVLLGRELIVGIGASQIISNVPAAVLLSGFTEQADGLLLGVNLGGLGTLIASLASLISYKQYAKLEGADPGRYLRVFTAINVIFLAVLLAFVFLFY